MLDLKKLQTEDGFCEVELHQVMNADLQSLPDNVTLHFFFNDLQQCYISAEGKFVIIQIETSLPNYDREIDENDSYASALVQVVKKLETQRANMTEEGIYLNGDTWFLYWSYREQKNIPVERLCRKIICDTEHITRIAKEPLPKGRV